MFDSQYQIRLVLWFDISSNELFQFMPQIFDWVHVWGFSWYPPPVDSLFKESSCFFLSCMNLCDSWYLSRMNGSKPACKIVMYYGCIHYTLENNDRSRSPFAYASPNVHFDWVLRAWFKRGRLPLLSVWVPSVTLQLHCCFISIDDIIKSSKYLW